MKTEMGKQILAFDKNYE